MRIGSLFSGIGGLDLACEWALGATTAWQLDLVGADVRRRHWPEAVQVDADITTVDPLTLPQIDVLCGGFPCTDLSVAGKRAGLDGAASGLYREVLRFAEAMAPRLVVIENVPGLLAYRARLDRDWRALGYGLTWVRARALDAGAPHLRARVFVVAQRGGSGGGVVEAPRDGAWSGDGRVWATPRTSSPMENPETMAKRSIRLRSTHCLAESLDTQVAPWVLADVPKYQPEREAEPVSEPLGLAVRPWPTATCSDAKGGWTTQPEQDRRGLLSDIAALGKRLNPRWVEHLMGYPEGWTLPEGERLEADPSPRWPRGRYPDGWDRSQHWPGYDWEPARTLPDGPPAKGRPAQLRALGNAVVPQCGAMAIRAALDTSGRLL